MKNFKINLRIKKIERRRGRGRRTMISKWMRPARDFHLISAYSVSAFGEAQVELPVLSSAALEVDPTGKWNYDVETS